MTTKLDNRVGRFLAGNFRHESRRSFLSQITRGLFALVGVSLPAIVKPYSVFADEEQQPPRQRVTHRWDWCGLHGPSCEGPCHPDRLGRRAARGELNRAMTQWVACCKNPANNKWRCVRYADHCGLLPEGLRPVRDCDGKSPSGPVWCAGVTPQSVGATTAAEADSFGYICTHVSVAATEYDEARGCARGCHPDDIHCEPQA